ncbi:MAG: hypothetical protein JEZ06_22070 [Anaerolineaceae bacterium]|nr:hypothetical protein [Anaerolineaceae bacterium]
MDILHLVDRLEELFNESRSIPFTQSVVIDEDRMLDIIDQMRVSIPEEIKKAQQLMAQKDRILAQSQEESNRTLAIAREKSKQLVEENDIVAAANERAKEILHQAKIDNEVTKREADEYVYDTLAKMEIELEKTLNQVRNGLRALQSSYPPSPQSHRPQATQANSEAED